MTDVDVTVLGDQESLVSFLDEYLNANGLMPERAGYDRNELPIFVWLDEEGGDCVILRACKLLSENGATSEPTMIFPEDLAYPVYLFGKEIILS